jgi:hypothetical protein
MKKLYFVLLSLFMCFAMRAQTYAAEFHLEEYDLHMLLNVYSETSLVSITMQGPSTVWFAFGFGAVAMKGSYVIVANEKGVEERFLDGRNEGELLPVRVKVISDTIISGVRKVELVRLIKGSGDNYYNFPRKGAQIPIIYALGKNTKSNRKHAKKGKAVILLE